jgi:hypothetical protein
MTGVAGVAGVAALPGPFGVAGVAGVAAACTDLTPVAARTLRVVSVGLPPPHPCNRSATATPTAPTPALRGIRTTSIPISCPFMHVSVLIIGRASVNLAGPQSEQFGADEKKRNRVWWIS